MLNFLYRLNIWLDNNEIIKFLLLMLFVALCVIPLHISTYFSLFYVGIPSIIIIFLYAIFRVFVFNGFIKFDRSKYDVPKVGETLIVKKDFYYDGTFKKFINQSDPSQKPNWLKVYKGTELLVLNVSEINGDWEVSVGFLGSSMQLNYLDTKYYWNTKSNIRNEILNKIGI